MNTNGLAKHYETLTPRERFPLTVAARLRGDVVEVERLLRSAPTALFRVPNFRGVAETMSDLALLHLVLQLDAAAWLWRIDGVLESSALLAGQGRDHEEGDARLLTVLRFRAYLFVVERDAWERFCVELHLDPDALLRDMPCYRTVKDAESIARLLAFTPTEAVEAARSKWDAGVEVRTVESACADYRAALAAREDGWT